MILTGGLAFVDSTYNKDDGDGSDDDDNNDDDGISHI